MQDSIPPAYEALAQQVFAQWSTSAVVTHAQDVAEAVWRAAVDANSPMRIAAGADAVELINEQSSAA
ncbi:hypothetical protein [Pseudomonas sp. S1_E04]